jgi:regulator of nucleoside diphosphate kinase
MVQPTERIEKPRIIVSDADYRRLSDLALGAQDRFPEVAAELQAELDRAEVVRDASISPDIVQMGSTVEFRTDTAQQKRVQLVFPGEADISQDRISVLTPIGVALIGLSAGQSITWAARDGKQHKLTVAAVDKREETAEVVAFTARRKTALKSGSAPDDEPTPPRAA